MQKTTLKRTMAAALCALMLCTLLLLAACGSYSSPGGSPQATPTGGGYNIIQLLDKELPFLSSLQNR